MTKSTEEIVNQVLAGLRDSEAPAEMERRILEAMRNRASVKSASTWDRSRPKWLIAPTARWAVALACAAAVSLAVSIMHRTERVPTQSTLHSIPTAAAPHPAPPKVLATTAQLPPPISSKRPTRRATPQKTVLVRDTGSAALSDLRASNHPAPPMPLTDQEKLLLRIAHKRAPEEMAELNPVQRAARNAQEKAEVQKFFEPATTSHNE